MNKNSSEVLSRIEEMEKQLNIIEARKTEVYARIVGYYRSVQNWNKGKKEEFKARLSYTDNTLKK